MKKQSRQPCIAPARFSCSAQTGIQHILRRENHASVYNCTLLSLLFEILKRMMPAPSPFYIPVLQRPPSVFTGSLRFFLHQCLIHQMPVTESLLRLSIAMLSLQILIMVHHHFNITIQKIYCHFLRTGTRVSARFPQACKCYNSLED